MIPKLLICGLEHTGTTLISELFRQVPGLDSGFECGVLLRDTPSEFRDLQPFAKHMPGGWGLTQEQFDTCCDAPDFTTFYRRLMDASTVLRPGTTDIFDKTPRYLAYLTEVLDRCDCPVIVSYKDPRAIVFSDFKRAKPDRFRPWYKAYRESKLRYMEAAYTQFLAHSDNPRVHFVRLEDLAMNARATMEAMFAHAGEAFSLDYAIINNVRHRANVKGRTVSAEIAFEYKAGLPKPAQRRILDDMERFEHWIYR